MRKGSKRRKIKIYGRALIVFIALIITVSSIILLKNYIFSSTNAHGKENSSGEQNELSKETIAKEVNKSIEASQDTPSKDKRQESINKTPDNRGNIILKKLKDKDIQTKALFLGDSVTESIGFYEFIDESRVIGQKGLTIAKAEKSIDKLKSAKVKNIFILLGTNDLESGMDQATFIKQYADLIDHIKENLPQSDIFIQSILPIDKNKEASRPNLVNSRIDEFNKALMELCIEKEVSYLNIATVLKNDAKLFEPDGIHPKFDFYKKWIDYLESSLQ